MAVDPLLEGIISISIEDLTAGRMDAIVSRVQAKLAELGNLPGAQVGEQIFGSVQGGAQATLGVIDQLKVALLEMNAAGRGMLAGGAAADSPQIAAMRETVILTDSTIANLKRLMVVQQEEQLTARQTAQVQREAMAVAAAPIAARVVEPVAPKLTGDAQLAAMGLQFQGGRVVPIGANANGAFPGAAAYGDIKAQVPTVTSVGEGTALEQAQAGLIKARSNLTLAIDKEYAVEEQRTASIAGSISSLIAADRRVGAAEDAQATAIEKATASAAAIPVNTKGVDPNQTAKIQQLQLDLATNVAKESTLKATLSTLAATEEGTGAEVQLTQARIRTLAVQERLTAAMEAQANGGSSSSGGGGMGGLQMLKYYAFYQVFQMGQSALTAVKTATEEYSLAVNQLSIALGVSYDQASKTAAGYAHIGQSLATPPAVAVTGATQYTRFFQDTSGSAGDIGATLGSTINLLEGRNAAQGQEQAMITKAMDEVGAIAQNYGTGASGASDLYSAATLIAQHYGTGGGSSVTAGTAQIADLLKQAGFTADQGMSLVGQVAQATGSTSDLAAGDLKRLLGRSGSNTFQSLFGEYGINPNQSTSKELGQLSLKFQDLTPTQQDSIITKLGGGRSGAAALATIVDYQSIMAEGNKAAANPNAAQNQADLKLATFAGQIEQIKTDLLGLATDLGSSGLGGAFTVLLAGVDPLIRGLDAIIQGLDILPGWLNTVAVGATALGIAFRVLGTGGMTDVLSKVGSANLLNHMPWSSAPEVAAVAPVAYTAAADSAAVSLAAAKGLSAAADERSIAATAAVTDARVAADSQVAGSAERLVVALDAETVAKAEATTAAEEATVAIRAQTVADAELATATAAATTGETEQAAGGLAKLGAAAGGAVLAMAPILAILGAIAAYGAAKSAADTGSQGAADALTGAKGGDAGVKAGSISQIRTAIANLNASQQDIANSSSGLGGGILYGISDALSFSSSSDLSATQQKALAAIAAKRAELLAAATALQARQDAWTAATPSSQLWGPGYADINTGVVMMAANQTGVLKSSQNMQDAIAGTTPGTVSGDLNVAAQLTPASPDKGFAAEVKRDIALAQKALSPLDQQAQLNSLMPLVALLKAEAAKVGDPTQRADALSAAAAIGDEITQATMTSLLKVTNDRIASIKAMSSNQGQNVTQIKALLTSSMTTADSAGDVTTLVALAALGDKQFLDNFQAHIQAQDKIAHDQLVTADAAAHSALAAARLQIAAAAPLPGPGGPDVPLTKAEQASPNHQKIVDVQGQIAGIKATEVADPFLAIAGSALELQKAYLLKLLDSLVLAQEMQQQQDAQLASLVSPASTTGPSINTTGGAQYGVSAPKPDAGKPKLTAAQQAQVDLAAKDKAIADQADKNLATINAAMGIAAPTGSAFQPGKAAADAYATQEAMLAAQATSGDPVSQAAAALRVAEYKMTESTSVGAVYWQNLKALHDAQYGLAQAQMSAANAQISASAISGDPMSAAAVAIAVATNTLNNAVGAAAYYGALKSLHDAQYAYAQAQMTAANDAYQLGLDLTNPVIVAQEKVREAQAQLAFDQGRGAGSDVTNKDALGLKQAQSAAEKSAFDQQFSDQSTNYNLQRESLGAYLSYLHAQHNYLTSVQSKTRQQVDELNQVDQALQGLANQMQGQFNLGAIKVPTVYEARAGTGLATTNNVTITINGTDIPAVKAVLTQYVGQAAMSTSGSAARKV